MLGAYYRLTKPGIVYGNVMTTVASFLFASRWQFGWGLFFSTIFGIGFVIAAACVFNNHLDRDIDAKMERTKNRPSVTGKVRPRNALIYGALLLIFGLLLLLGVNVLTACIALGGFLFYLWYTFVKRRSTISTMIGAVAGAVPIVVGYTAIVGYLDLTALILFFILVFWQMPHFYAIALRRADDYVAAGIPTLPERRGIRVTKRRMIAYVAAYLLAACALATLGFANQFYFVVVLLSGIVWLAMAFYGFSSRDTLSWSRGVFVCSLAVLVSFSFALAFASLP